MRGTFGLISLIVCHEFIFCNSLLSVPLLCVVSPIRRLRIRRHNLHNRAWCLYSSTSAAEKDVPLPPTTNTTTRTSSNIGEKNVTSETNDAALLLQQAKTLREQASAMAQALNASLAEKAKREEEKIDRWIAELLIAYKVDNMTEILSTVDQAVERLQQDRYSQEQINKIFKRLCEVGPKQSRSSHSPLMALLVESVGKMDDLERKDNPNKRWSGKVEQLLQKKLFAADWNIELEDEEEKDRWNPFKLP